MEEYKLKITYEEMIEKVNNQIEKINNMISNPQITNEEEQMESKIKKRELIVETFDLLNSFFINGENLLIKDFKKSCYNRIPNIYSGRNIEISKSKEEYINSLNQIISCLKGFLKDASLSDIILDFEKVVQEKRDNMKLKDKKIFTLKKLLEAGENYWDVKILLESNGIKFTSDQLLMEMLEGMEIQGLIERFPALSSNGARITSTGTEYLEELEHKNFASENPSQEEKRQMFDKINKILEELNLAGVEREVIFNELQEVKELYSQLKKKNWKEMVFGKLTGLAFSKTITKEHFQFIYEQLTGHQLSILSNLKNLL